MRNEFPEVPRGINSTVSGDGPSGGLDWGEIENFGTGIEAGNFTK